ncbi:hypothetical protein EVAR_34384_1 [Eumeta japonica]|uniref:Uncharacterized protein n=1 Tax=Eumeta variegata TaxID=151549 RepID=A0A4C1WXF5_EUMVA|nr:hypothetical protein EVAR_34384_1 [Eumeta japonica]
MLYQKKFAIDCAAARATSAGEPGRGGRRRDAKTKCPAATRDISKHATGDASRTRHRAQTGPTVRQDQRGIPKKKRITELEPIVPRSTFCYAVCVVRITSETTNAIFPPSRSFTCVRRGPQYKLWGAHVNYSAAAVFRRAARGRLANARRRGRPRLTRD